MVKRGKEECLSTEAFLRWLCIYLLTDLIAVSVHKVLSQKQKCMVRLVVAIINFDNGVGYALMYSESD
jgi:hypothetical protein